MMSSCRLLMIETFSTCTCRTGAMDKQHRLSGFTGLLAMYQSEDDGTMGLHYITNISTSLGLSGSVLWPMFFFFSLVWIRMTYFSLLLFLLNNPSETKRETTENTLSISVRRLWSQRQKVNTVSCILGPSEHLVTVFTPGQMNRTIYSLWKTLCSLFTDWWAQVYLRDLSMSPIPQAWERRSHYKTHCSIQIFQAQIRFVGLDGSYS